MKRWWMAAATACLFSLLFTVQPLRDPDVWWHLALGRYIATFGFPQREPFSFLTPAHSWVSQQWLYELGLWKIYSTWGIWPISLLMGLLASGAMLLAAASQPHLNSRTAVPTALGIGLVSLVCGQIVGVRGQVISLFGVALILLLLKRWRQGSLKVLWFIPVTFCLWANLHAGFVIGLALILAALLFITDVPAHHRKYLFLALLAAILATLINPWGPGLWEYIAAYPTLNNQSIEWMSPDFHNIWMRVFEVSVLILALVWIVGKRPRAFEFLIAVGALLAALQAQRNVSVFAIIALPQIAEHGSQSWERLWHTRRITIPQRICNLAPALAAGISVGVVAGSGIFLAGSLRPQAESAFVAQTYPQAAVSYAVEHFPKARIYTPDTWGGYLAYRAPQGRVVFVYDETTIFGKRNLADYQEIHLLAPGFANVLSQERLEVAIVGRGSQEVAALTVLDWNAVCEDRPSGALVMAASARKSTELPNC